MADKNYITLTSEQGKSLWAKVNTQVDTYMGEEKGYSINVYFSDSYTKKLEKKFKELIEEAKASGEYVTAKGKPKEWRENPKTPIKVDDDGKKFVVFKTNHLDKEGNRKYVKVFDKFNRDLGNEVTIGNDSIVRISFSPSVYHLTSENNGIKCYLNAIQVLDLKTFVGGGSNGESYGFEASTEFPTEDDSECPI